MKYLYYIAFKINGIWSEDINFVRDLLDESPLDETLDTAVVVDVPASLRLIPPFTLCRITTRTADTNEIVEKRYYYTGNRTTEAVTLFQR